MDVQQKKRQSAPWECGLVCEGIQKHAQGSEVGCQDHHDCFYWEETVGWQVVDAEIMQALVLILLVYHDWMHK